jgi:hypothetical protein
LAFRLLSIALLIVCLAACSNAYHGIRICCPCSEEEARTAISKLFNHRGILLQPSSNLDSFRSSEIKTTDLGTFTINGRILQDGECTQIEFNLVGKNAIDQQASKQYINELSNDLLKMMKTKK